MSEFVKIILTILTVTYISCLFGIGINLWQTSPIKEVTKDVHFYIVKELTDDLN